MAESGSDELGTGLTVSMIIFYIVVILLSMASGLVFAKVALQDTRGVKPTWNNAFQGVPWANGILVYLLMFAVVLVAYIAVAAVSFGLSALHPILGGIFFFAAFVAIFFLYPFLVLVPYYAIDGKTSPVGALSAAWKDVKAQYWQVFGAIILLSLACGAIAFFTLGFGVFIVAPVQILGTVFVYRWISEHGSTSQGTTSAGTAPGNNYGHPEQPGGYMSMY